MSMVYYTVYRTLNLVNKKFYIGAHKTTELNDGYLGSGVVLRHAIRKYGRNSFVKEILFVFETEQEMFDKERELVEAEKQNAESYNIAGGGHGGWSYASTKNRWINSPEHRKMLETLSVETRDRRSISLQRKWDTDLEFRRRHRMSIAERRNKTGHWGPRNQSSEVRRTISDKLKERYRQKEHPCTNSKWMHFAGAVKKVGASQIAEHLELGWEFGRKP